MIDEEYEEAIRVASRELSCMDGLDSLEPFLTFASSKDQELKSLPKPNRRHIQKLLAGIFARAGNLRQASRILLNSEALFPNPADALIVDPGFVHIDGHHFNTNVFYQRMIGKLGFSSRVLRSMSDHPSLTGEETGSTPMFALSPYENLFPDTLPISGLRELNTLFSYEFARTLPKDCPRLTIVHTARHTFIEGFCRYLALAKHTKPASVLIGVIETEAIAVDHPHHEEIKAIYYRSFALLKTLPHLRLMVVVETDSVAEYLDAIIGSWVDIKVLPFVGGYIDEIPKVSQKPENSTPVIGFVGQTRAERGALIIPEVARLTLENSKYSSCWKVQLNETTLTNQANSSLNSELAWLKESPGIEFVEQNLPLIEYHELLSSIDIMVMPYSDRYETTGSGINIESLKFGHIQVVPENSSMARIANGHGAGVVTFSNRSATEVSDAVMYALQDFAQLRTLSLQAAKKPKPETLAQLEDFLRGS